MVRAPHRAGEGLAAAQSIEQLRQRRLEPRLGRQALHRDQRALDRQTRLEQEAELAQQVEAIAAGVPVRQQPRNAGSRRHITSLFDHAQRRPPLGNKALDGSRLRRCVDDTARNGAVATGSFVSKAGHGDPRA